MIASQRKAHRVIWLILVIVIPILLFFAVKNLDFSSAQNNSQKEQISAQMKEGKVQIDLHTSFASPSAVVYELTREGKAGKVLGQLEGVGEYAFQVSDNIKGILVFDKIKDEELLKIEF